MFTQSKVDKAPATGIYVYEWGDGWETSDGRPNSSSDVSEARITDQAHNAIVKSYNRGINLACAL